MYDRLGFFCRQTLTLLNRYRASRPAGPAGVHAAQSRLYIWIRRRHCLSSFVFRLRREARARQRLCFAQNAIMVIQFFVVSGPGRKCTKRTDYNWTKWRRWRWCVHRGNGVECESKHCQCARAAARLTSHFNCLSRMPCLQHFFRSNPCIFEWRRVVRIIFLLHCRRDETVCAPLPLGWHLYA